MPKKKAARPRLFIGSSAESADYAYAIQQNLDEDAEVTVWTQGIFDLTRSSLRSLLIALDKFDFGVFVFAPNDALRLRQKKYQAVRDNVIFELGLFMGRLGSERTFMVVPKGAADLRIPTDLTGITPGKFDSHRRDKNLEAAFGPFCNQVRRELRRKGRRVRSRHRNARRPSTAKGDLATPSTPKGDLLITGARYGIRDHRVDVTQQLNDAVIADKLHIFVGNQIAGDPSPNVPKNMIVKYKYKGSECEKIVAEGSDLDLP
jgi:hypothetical protein